MKNVLIIGATSAIAQATARLYAKDNCNFYLMARNSENLETLVNDLKARGARNINPREVDLADNPDYHTLFKEAFETLVTVDICLIAHGTLPNQQLCQERVDEALSAIQLNGTSTVALLTEVANKMENQQSGTIAAITSVAGDRGRQSNYVYGSAKSMVSTFLQGLRNRLHKSGVHVIDIKPGFVDTPMTTEFDKNFLWSTPDVVGEKIYKSINAGQNNTVYVPSFWRIIMSVIKTIPEFIFRKMSL